MNVIKRIKKETWLEILFLAILFCFYFMWARIQPLNSSPDEQMRYRIAQYIYEHGSIPRGDDPAVRDAVWGISYAFMPALEYMLCAVFMKIMSFVSTAPFALLMAARTVNMLCGVGMAFFTMRIGKRVFTKQKAWLLMVFVALLPESVFVFSYVNPDALAMFSSAIIVYAWVCGMQEGWSYRNCVILSIGVGICGLSYYNAYGFILCSILMFGITLFLEAQKTKDYRTFVKKGIFVCVLILAMVAWWFIRNAILYDGDFLGRTASAISAEKYAMDGYKPSTKVLPSNSGMTFFEMLTEGFAGTTVSWIELVSRSFVGRFGSLDVCMPAWVENQYLDFIKFGFLLVFLHPVRSFAIRRAKKDLPDCQQDISGRKQAGGAESIGRGSSRKGGICKRSICNGIVCSEAIFHWCMLIAIIVPNVLNAYYSYTSDYQPQGRYSLPMLIPLAYFVVMGYGNIFDTLVKNEKIRRVVYAVFCILFAILAAYVYLTVFWPEYRDGVFSIGAFIRG